MVSLVCSTVERVATTSSDVLGATSAKGKAVKKCFTKSNEKSALGDQSYRIKLMKENYC